MAQAALVEQLRAVLMPVGNLTVDAVEERLLEARRTYKLNLG